MRIAHHPATLERIIITIWGLILLSCHADEHSPANLEVAPRFRPHNYELHLGSNRVQFDPDVDTDIARLRFQVAAALETSNSTAQLSQAAAKRCRRGLKEIKRLADSVLDSLDREAKANRIGLLLETVAAVNNGQRSPLPKKLDGLQTVAILLQRLRVPVGQGQTPATNLQLPTAEQASGLMAEPTPDLSRVDPAPSSFWQRPTDIPAADLYHGFGRTRRFEPEDSICTYAGPKKGHGLNPGFEVNCDGQKVKLKFAELSSEPFATRIFSALGYHVDPTDFARQVKVRYDRRILQEFNSRKEMKIHFTSLFFLPIYTLELQKRYQPFNYISAAVLRDGHTWSGAELKSRLFYEPLRPHPEEDTANFRPEVEMQIDYLVTAPANLQPAEPAVKSIGPWDFAQLEHADLRELRGVGLLAAWLGWFDTRFDNTRLRIVGHGKNRELVHYFSDLGGVLGQTSGFLFSRGELPNDFPWTFTRPPLRQGPHHLARPLRIHGYKPIASTPAFAAMTIDDARWMARLIARLTEPQLIQAFVASGYDSAEVHLYTEKLLSRRDRMIIDLGLGGEISLLRPAGVNRIIYYDPATDGPVTISVPGESSIHAVTSRLKVIRGKLTP